MKKFILTICLLIIVITYLLSHKLNSNKDIDKNNLNLCKVKNNNEEETINSLINLNYSNPILFEEGKYFGTNKSTSKILSFNMLDDYNLFNKNIQYRICFGSCNYQHNNQGFWEKIIHFNPNLWIFLGDNVYTDKTDKWEEILEKPSIDNMIEQYEILVSSIPFRKFMLNSNIKKIGIWDDHDYLINNANVLENNNYKMVSKKLFTMFLEIGDKHVMIQREGIYTYYDLVISNQHLIRFFMLDVRTFRTDVDILGNEQWKWLEDNLSKSTARINVICSGSVVLTKINNYDSWFKNGWAYNRLINLLENLKIKNIVILSGDIHQGRLISKNNMIEIVSSPLSSPITKYNEDTEYNIGKVVTVHNFGFIDIINENTQFYLIGGLIDFDGITHNLIKITI